MSAVDMRLQRITEQKEMLGLLPGARQVLPDSTPNDAQVKYIGSHTAYMKVLGNMHRMTNCM